MQMVQQSPGCHICYTGSEFTLLFINMEDLLDTDSIILECPRGKCPIPGGGAFLGEMAREYPDSEILEVVSAGPKQYALKLQNKIINEVSYSMKHRGITINVKNEGRMSYEKFKELVCDAYGPDYDRETINPVFNYNRIGPDKSSSMFTREISKIYRCVNTKGYSDEDGVIFPYGY
jgi:hypothetical protein